MPCSPSMGLRRNLTALANWEQCAQADDSSAEALPGSSKWQEWGGLPLCLWKLLEAGPTSKVELCESCWSQKQNTVRRRIKSLACAPRQTQSFTFSSHFAKPLPRTLKYHTTPQPQSQCRTPRSFSMSLPAAVRLLID